MSFIFSILTFTCLSLFGVLGVFVLTGLTGLFSLGQASFMAIGAYVSGVLDDNRLGNRLGHCGDISGSQLQMQQIRASMYCAENRRTGRQVDGHRRESYQIGDLSVLQCAHILCRGAVRILYHLRGPRHVRLDALGRMDYYRGIWGNWEPDGGCVVSALAWHASGDLAVCFRMADLSLLCDRPGDHQFSTLRNFREL